ncbi:MAG: hypothetical protein A2W19_06760 [Spirochaetes bacterium RBG_16_49_21]|nr:MAG: hypothetical protein A2W19_06760 [Spirochaetes bacterium RBG_16_49_21]
MKNAVVWQLQNAKNRFSELVKKASAGAPQLVTKNSKPVVYVIDVDMYNKRFAHGKKSKKSILLNRPHKDIKISIERSGEAGREVPL